MEKMFGLPGRHHQYWRELRSSSRELATGSHPTERCRVESETIKVSVIPRRGELSWPCSRTRGDPVRPDEGGGCEGIREANQPNRIEILLGIRWLLPEIRTGLLLVGSTPESIDEKGDQIYLGRGTAAGL